MVFHGIRLFCCLRQARWAVLLVVLAGFVVWPASVNAENVYRIFWFLGDESAPLGNDTLLNPDRGSTVAIKIEGMEPGEEVRIILCEEDWISDDDKLHDLGTFTANGAGEVWAPGVGGMAPPPHQVDDAGSESEIYALVFPAGEERECGCGRYRSPMIRVNDEIVEESVATTVQEVDWSVNGGLAVPFSRAGIGGALSSDVVAGGRYRMVVVTKSGVLDPEVHLELALLSELPHGWKLGLATPDSGESTTELSFSLVESHSYRNLSDPWCKGEGAGHSCMPIFLDAYTPTGWHGGV